MSEKVWFITGASRGFGRIWAADALKRGDKVVATARSLADIAPLADQFGDAVLPLALDVTNRDQVADVVAKAHAHFGRLDIVLNNAGYAETRAQVFAGGANTNFGDPAATSASLFKIVDSEPPPLRFFLGAEGLPVARAAYAERLSVWESWADASNAAQGQPRKQTLDL
jgi:NAD(P)-dependent dehydrogenase (short-subunit alcohol dehydrogenase family)